MLQAIDLRDRAVTGDALFCQRGLSRQVIAHGGDYFWVVKDNQREGCASKSCACRCRRCGPETVPRFEPLIEPCMRFTSAPA